MVMVGSGVGLGLGFRFASPFSRSLPTSTPPDTPTSVRHIRQDPDSEAAVSAGSRRRRTKHRIHSTARGSPQLGIPAEISGSSVFWFVVRRRISCHVEGPHRIIQRQEMGSVEELFRIFETPHIGRRDSRDRSPRSLPHQENA